MSYLFNRQLAAVEKIEEAARDLTDAQFERAVEWVRAERADKAPKAALVETIKPELFATA